MSWSFLIRNGDLTLSGPGGYSLVTGYQKLVQDLKHWILEDRGTDPLHPDFGSTIDGGTLPDGTIVETNIGSVIDKARLLSIESEIRRVLFAYQDQQLNRLIRENALYNGKNTFAPNEILYSVDDVQIAQVQDVIVANVKIRTDGGQSINFSTPIS